MKNFLINLFFLAIGIFGTIGYQTYFPSDEQATTSADSTKVDSAIVPEVSPIVTTQDTAKDSVVK